MLEENLLFFSTNSNAREYDIYFEIPNYSVFYYYQFGYSVGWNLIIKLNLKLIYISFRNEEAYQYIKDNNIDIDDLSEKCLLIQQMIKLKYA